MSGPVTFDGGTPVGSVDELGELEARVVLCLRLWCDGPEAQARVWNELAATLGPAAGRAALTALERLAELVVRHGRRPLMRHRVECRCLGADEAAFAAFVAAAANGEREDAMLFASLILRPDMAPAAAAQATQFGLALRRALLRAPAHSPFPRPARLH